MADPISHDQNFKNLIVDYPRKALEFFAPEEAPRPEEAARVVPVREEMLQERLGDRYRRLDVPLMVQWEDKSREPILFLVEEESDRHRFSPRRLAYYDLDLGGMFDTVRVVPVVVFLRSGPAPRPLHFTERGAYHTVRYLHCSLGDMPAEDWLDSGNVVARVNLPNMRRPPGMSKVEVYAHAVRGLFDLEPDLDRRAKYMDFIDIYADLTDNERRSYRQQHPEESSMIVGLNQRAREEGLEQGIARGIEQGIEQGIARGIEQGIEQGIERGIERGIEQGVRQGRAQGERALLERQLLRRFGTLPPAIGEQLGAAAEAELEVWADRVLDAATLDDVFDTGRG